MGFWFVENKVTHVENAIYSLGCSACRLSKQSALKHPKIEPFGSKDPYFYVLGECPDEVEDRYGEHFKGKSSSIVRKSLYSVFGKDTIDNHFRWNYCVRCRPMESGHGRRPTDTEVDFCRKSVEEDIEKTKPLFILGFGSIPLKWVKGTGVITMWRGRATPVKIGKHECWYFPMLDPYYLLRKNWEGKEDVDKNMLTLFESDIKRVYSFALQENVPIPQGIYSGYEDNVKYVLGKNTSDIKIIRQELKNLAQLPFKAIDIETLKLRPYEKDARLLTAAIGTYDQVFSFPINHPSSVLNVAEVMGLLKNFLYEDKGFKIAHNAIFEMVWLSYFFGKDVLYKTKWADTQAQAYTLDERTKKQAGMLNLNTLTQLHFDFPLKALSNFDPENPLNMTLEALLLYNGMDSKFEEKLFWTQNPFLQSNPKLFDFYNHLMETAITLVGTHYKGLDLDFNKITELDDFLSKEIEILDEKIKNDENVSRIYNFNIDSPPHLVSLFRDILKIPLIKETDTGGYSTDHEVLEKLAEDGIEIAESILSYRELSKIHRTYIRDIDKYIYNKKIYPWYNHLLTSTTRLSSDGPNVQNFPKRKYKQVRSIVKAPEGQWIVSFDLGQIEARVIAMASKDKVFCDALHTGYDVHMEWAKRVIEAYPKAAGVRNLEEATPKRLKDFRGVIKNKLVFPWFFLASPYSVGTSLGVPNTIIRDIYDDFWDMFKGIKKWQQQVLDFYREFGYVETLFGSRRHGPLSVNMIVNSPIQGTASTMVIKVGNRLAKYAYETEQERFHFNLNIHDDLTFLLPDETLEDDIQFIAREMCNMPYDFVNVPITAEAAIGKDWGTLEDLQAFDSREFGFRYGGR